MSASPQQFQYGTNSSVTLGPRKSRCAIFSMILGILALPGIILCFTSVPLGIVSVVLGAVGLGKIKGSGGRLSGGGMAWTGIVLSLVAIGLTIPYFNFIKDSAEQENQVPKTPLAIAESNILTDNNGVYHGNTPAARELAKAYSESIAGLNETFFTREGRQGMSLSGNKFITHCQVGDGTVAFLVHVPSYRKYTDDAKEALATLAWQAAQMVALTNPDQAPAGARLAVGLKGVILYGAVMTGTVAETADADPSTLITSSGTDQSKLNAFFVAPAAPAEPAETTPDAAAEGD